MNNIGGNTSLFKRNEIINLPIKQAYSTFEMKTGIIYEHLFTNKMVFSASGGIRSTFTSKVFGGANSKDPFIKNTESRVPYIKVGLSFLPFWKGFVK